MQRTQGGQMPDDAVADPRRVIAQLRRKLARRETELARRTAERDAALAREAAGAAIINVINTSPGDLAPVFDAILERALQLCDAAFGFMATYNGESFRTVAQRNTPPAFAEFSTTSYRPGPGTSTLRLVEGEPFVHIEDMLNDEGTREGDPGRQAMIELAKGRTQLAVALRKGERLLGDFIIYRQEVRPFTDAQIALLRNFAAQAVIAMENARLFNDLNERSGELQEALEYQTATSNVLQVISRSAFDLQRVLETLAESAAALAQSDTVFIFRREGEGMRLVAQYAPTPAYGQVIGNLILGPDRRSTTGRAFLGGEV